MSNCEDCLEYKFLTVLKQNAEYLKSIAKSLETIAAKPPVAVTLEITEDILTEMQAREMLK